MRLDRSLELIDEHPIHSDLTAVRESVVQGLEDCRLFQTTHGPGFTCTTLEYHPLAPWRMSLFDLSRDGRATRHRPLRGYHDDETQKNWLPFGQASELFMVYGYEPFTILRVDQDTGECESIAEAPQHRNFDLFRGSAGPVDLPASAGGGKLLIVHEVSFHNLRYYLHRFLRVDDDWRIVEASPPFFFRRRTIEFCSGACLSHDADLLITFGVQDREAWLCRVSLEEVAKQLRPLP